MRAVLDLNVLISGLLSPSGAPAALLSSWQRGRFELVVSPMLIEELRRALAYPKLRRRIPAEDAIAAETWLAAAATHADDPTGDPPVRSDDPGDDYLIALAAAHHAALVSGDRHLLALSGSIPVYSAREFLDALPA